MALHIELLICLFPLPVVWNFAIHGTCLGSHNLQSSADVMGGVNTYLEHNLVGGVAFFINADAGDIAPSKHQPMRVQQQV